jgi:hypothetical protein
MTPTFPRNWAQWLPLAEWLYKKNYHTALKSTPFEALYGYIPPQLPMGSLPSCKTGGVEALLKERHKALLVLQDNLKKAQPRNECLNLMIREEQKGSCLLGIGCVPKITAISAGKHETRSKCKAQSTFLWRARLRFWTKLGSGGID